MAAKLAITGNLTKDPELKPLGGKQACVFTVAVRTRLKNTADGTYKSNFYDCTWFGTFAEGFYNRIQKGTGVTVWGELAADTYTAGDTTRMALKVTVDTAEAQSRLKETASVRQPVSVVTDENIIPF